MEKKHTVRELVGSLEMSYKVLGSLDREVLAPAPLGAAEAQSFSFCSSKGVEALRAIRDSRASVIVCPEGLALSRQDYHSRTLIAVAKPRLAFIKLLWRFFSVSHEYGIHPSAVIDPRAELAENVFIGPHAYIGVCRIGEGSVIYGNAHIYSGTRIGKRVTIHAGTVIGSDGFGYERDDDGRLEKFPQIGGVVIEDDVEIGSNASIDRGTMGDTVIGEGTKIDNLCHIAHNVTIGRHCLIIALTMIGGSTRVGDYSHIAPCACLMNKIEVGRNALVGMGAVVTRNVAANLVVMGVPAKPVRGNVPETSI